MLRRAINARKNARRIRNLDQCGVRVSSDAPGHSAAPFVVRVALDDLEFARRLPTGSTGDAAVFTDRVQAFSDRRRY
jgi:hypothetical protein